ncbi:MAG: 16S rRNA processing protein RimM [Myxococcota bacterium]
MSRESRRLELGVVGKPHGIRGGVRIFLHNRESDALRAHPTVVVVSPKGDVQEEWELATVRPGPKAGAWLVTTPSVADRTAAEQRTGWKVVLDSELLPELRDADEFYYHQLAGCQVQTPSGRKVGRVERVTDTQIDVLEVAREGGGELLVPVVKHFVLEISAQQRTVTVVEDLEELLGVDEPETRPDTGSSPGSDKGAG